ncbi:NUDIX hydrolase [Nonomuraea rubra]
MLSDDGQDGFASGHPGQGRLLVVAAAILVGGRLLVVSKRVAEGVFYLPGGKPEPGEDVHTTLIRELREELGVRPLGVRHFALVEDIAALERVPMRMHVFLATIVGDPLPGAEIAKIGWTTGRDELAPLLAPAVRDKVIPALVAARMLAG